MPKRFEKYRNAWRHSRKCRPHDRFCSHDGKCRGEWIATSARRPRDGRRESSRVVARTSWYLNYFDFSYISSRGRRDIVARTSWGKCMGYIKIFLYFYFFYIFKSSTVQISICTWTIIIIKKLKKKNKYIKSTFWTIFFNKKMTIVSFFYYSINISQMAILPRLKI